MSSAGKKAYAKSGVDVDLGNRVKATIPMMVKSTHRPEVLGKIGGFGGLFRGSFPKMKDPVIVSSIDGVGTKLKVAQLAKHHGTVGEDLVNHCVNDIAVVGGKPLFFLDYIGTALLRPKVFREILQGVVRGCRNAGCALIGGETAQMPGLYHGEDYDLVGCIVGVVDRKDLLDGSKIRVGDVVIGMASSGLHTNGYALARQLLLEQERMSLASKPAGLTRTLGQELLSVHINYEPLLCRLRKDMTLKGAAHITGGGLMDNLPRILPKGMDAAIQLGSWPVPPIFQLLASLAEIPNSQLYQVWNMGIGMVAVVPAEDEARALAITRGYRIGKIVKGTGRVQLLHK